MRRQQPQCGLWRQLQAYNSSNLYQGRQEQHKMVQGLVLLHAVQRRRWWNQMRMMDRQG